MLKLLILMLMCLSAQAKDVEPKFFMDQHITYKVSFFYHKVCSGKGIVKEVRSESDGSFTYTLNTPANDYDCPQSIDISEKDIKAAE